MSKEYDEYLENHICCVQAAAMWMDHNGVAVGELTPNERWRFKRNVMRHDGSKYRDGEYGPYDAYFYGERDQEAFDRAWLHHIHNNPHHWQYWLLMNDDGKYREPDKVVALEMPEVRALEMVADWWSFSWRSGNLSEVFGWYEDHKENIILHENTRAYVEGVLSEIREKIEAE